MRTISNNSIRDELAGGPVHVQHVLIDSSELGMEEGSNRRTGRNVGLHDIAHNLDGIRIFKYRGVLVGLADDRIPGGVGQRHETIDQSILKTLLALGRNHITACLVESVDLLGRQITGDFSHIPYDFLDEWFALAWLEYDKVALAFVRDLDESIASHVLHACLFIEVSTMV